MIGVLADGSEVEIIAVKYKDPTKRCLQCGADLVRRTKPATAEAWERVDGKRVKVLVTIAPESRSYFAKRRFCPKHEKNCARLWAAPHISASVKAAHDRRKSKA